MIMKKKTTYRYRVYTSAIAFCLYLFIAGFPYKKVGLSDNASIILSSSLRLVFSLLCFYVLFHDSFYFPSTFPKDKKRALLFLPFFLICFSNLFVLAFNPSSINLGVDLSKLGYSLFYYFSIAVAEEMVFRLMIESLTIEKMRPVCSILIASGIFALSHFVNFLGGQGILLTLAQVGYTFLMGLILGLFYEYGGGIIYLFFFHFIFDFINNGVCPLISNASWDLTFYLVNGGIALLIVIYGAFLWRYLEKERLNELSLSSSSK